jgi:hypothetical protein
MKFGGDNEHPKERICPKNYDLKLPTTPGIVKPMPLPQEHEEHKNHQNRSRYRGFVGARSPSKEEQGPHTRHPTRIPQRNTPKTSPRKFQEKALKITKKNEREQHIQALRNHAESSIHHKEVHTRSSLPPNHPSLSQDLTMKLSS